MSPRAARAGLPLLVLALAVLAWEAHVALAGVPAYILPAPSRIARTLVADWPLLWASLLVTLRTSGLALLLALLGGVGLGVLMSVSAHRKLVTT